MKTKKPGIFDRPEFEETYQKFFEKLLDDNRIKIIDTEQIEILELDFKSILRTLKDRASGNSEKMLEQLEPRIKQTINADPSILKDKTANFDITLQNLDLVRKIFEDTYITVFPAPKAKTWKLYELIIAIFADYEYRLSNPPGGADRSVRNTVDLQWILDNYVINQGNGQKLCLIVSSEKEKMVEIIDNLLSDSLKSRRKTGTKKHDVLFVIDEAHEFVLNPNESGVSDNEKKCSRVIERLTRMGRKYGLGICMASQRTAYLNTTALSNCHTTFVGALPRKYDRTTLTEAYAVSPEVVDRVVTFPTGNWYIVSNGAMGVNNVPIRIVSKNREAVLSKYFMDRGYFNAEGNKTLIEQGNL